MNCFILSTLFTHSLNEINMNTKKVCNTIKYRISHGWFEIRFLQRVTTNFTIRGYDSLHM